MTAVTDTQRIRRNRIILIGVFAVAIVPLLAAYLLYQSSRSAEPWATTNKGQLMRPIRPVSDLDLVASDGATSMQASGSWWLVTVADGACEADCQAALHELRQLHVLLGRDAGRVKRAFVQLGAAEPGTLVLQDYPEVNRFDGPTHALTSGVYIIDPLGNLVLQYVYADAGKPVLDDLKQLLKVSHIG